MSVAQYASPRRRRRRRPRAGERRASPGTWSPATSTCSPGYVRDALAQVGGDDGCEVLFTAHSLPQRILAGRRPVPRPARRDRRGARRARRRRALVGRLAERRPHRRSVDRPRRPGRAAQPRGRTAPRAIVVCSCGFVADHLEVLYDLDIEAAGVADELGIAFARTASPNADPAFTATLAGVVREPRSRRASGRPMSRRVVIVGGGIAGLAAAHALASAPDAPEVTLLDASTRVGGRITTVPFGGVDLDVGPDALLSRAPGATALCRELGLGDDLDAVRRRRRLRLVARRAAPAARRAARGPARRPRRARCARGSSRPPGSRRASLDLVLPRRGPAGDEAIGELVRRRFGRQVLDRLVDPLLGGINAGNCDDLSVAAGAPYLAAAAAADRSLRPRAARDDPVAAARVRGPRCSSRCAAGWTGSSAP